MPFLDAMSIPSQTSVKFFPDTIKRPDHPHCPLCIDSMIHPEQDERPPTFIFLDMDGVMLSGRGTPKYHKKMSKTFFQMFPGETTCNEYQSLFVNAEHLDPAALKNLQVLVERIEKAGNRALILLSTSWRYHTTLLEFREKVFAKHLFSQYLCGKVAPENSEAKSSVDCIQGFEFAEGAKERFGIDLKKTADAIEYWLRDHGFDPDATNFVVFDDDDSRGLSRFGPRYIHVSCYVYSVLNEKHIEQAAQALKV